MNVETRKLERWKIALICHTLLVTITFVYVLYDWKASTGESFYMWALVAVLDIPATAVFFALEYFAHNAGLSGTFRGTIMAFMVFTVVGGAQWFLIFGSPPN
ncbi:MAG TPA: hypothetical protein PKN33_21440 [Phycisphaerae bacterium]|nr:hypothetical protein [Phycisphaerae bacterium]